MRMPTWKETARTVFSSSVDEESSLPDVNNTETNFIPKHRRSRFLYYKTSKKQTNPNDETTTDDNETAPEEWATPSTTVRITSNISPNTNNAFYKETNRLNMDRVNT